ncbi:MAG: hypothetical protein H7249_16585 [Chitinophagaceae bacterium]|nr:hypothetical protein [Oligoflexus sp.]
MTELAQEGSIKKKKAVEPQDDADQDLRAGAQSGGKKLRLTLVEDEQSLLFGFQQTLKERGVKNFELGDIVAEALATIPKEWWDAKVEEITPLEWKLHAALENPDMREKLMSLLNGQK